MADWNYKSFWDESLSQLKKELGDEEFEDWFNKLEYIRSEEKEIFASAPSSFFLEMFSPKYLPWLESRIEKIAGKNLAIILEPQKKAVGAKDVGNPEAPTSKKAAQEGERPCMSNSGARNPSSFIEEKKRNNL